jgi:hypothetical protein
LVACGSSRPKTGATALPAPAPTVARPPALHGPAFGLTEDNADLLWSPGQSPGSAETDTGRASFQSAEGDLTALHPSYIRLLVDWAALQPGAAGPASLDAQVSGCARTVGPCGPYAGIREELAAIASQRHAAQKAGTPGPEVVIQIFGAPAWAARAPAGCELAGTQPFSRPLNATGIVGYQALIRSLLALGTSEGVPLEWWSAWNEPNDPVFISPQRDACAADAPPVSPAVYAQLVRAMAAELHADGGQHHLLLGELNAYQSDSPHHTSIAQFVASLPADVLCLSDVWSIHSYASRGAAAPPVDPVKALEAALDARGECGQAAHIWVTEAGAGAAHPGRRRPPGEAEERAGCEALGEQLLHWYADPRVGAVFQYSFREDPAFAVGLVSADLSHIYPAYRLWLSYTRLRASGRPPPSPGAGCA